MNLARPVPTPWAMESKEKQRSGWKWRNPMGHSVRTNFAGSRLVNLLIIAWQVNPIGKGPCMQFYPRHMKSESIREN